MDYQPINWADVYQSLQTDTIKNSGKLMLMATLIAVLIIILIFILFFRKNPVIIIFIVVGAFMFSGKYALGLLRLSKDPKVYSGLLISKSENSFTDESTMTSYVSHHITLIVESASRLTEKGLGEIKFRRGKRRRINCSEDVYNNLTEGDKIIVVVMPHDKSIGWYFNNVLKY